MRKLLILSFLQLFFGSLSLAGEQPSGLRSVGEPADYRMENYQAPTPATLKGARVVSTSEARALWEQKAAVFIDSMPRAPKPKNLPANTIWRDIPRFNIPGSAWLVDVGYGALSGERDEYFRSHLRQLTGRDHAKAILFYCKAACWMSWNAAKRALEYGYTNVIWYPEGSEGWSAAGFDLKEDRPLP